MLSAVWYYHLKKIVYQHNAAKAIAPATVQLLQKAFLNSNDNLQLASAVLHCETAVVHSLMNTRPDQVRITIKFNIV